MGDAPESKLAARELAITMIKSHLAAGHDVVLPQFLGKTDFIERLEQTAVGTGSHFVEVMLVVGTSAAEARFVERRVEMNRTGERHPESDIADVDVDVATMIAEADGALSRVLKLRPSILRVQPASDTDGTLVALHSALDDGTT